MTFITHDHTVRVPGCFRCELGADEAAAIAADVARDIARAEEAAPGYEHDDMCADELTYSGACKHYTPGKKSR